MTTKNKKSSTIRWLCSVPVTIVARLGTDSGRVKRRVETPKPRDRAYWATATSKRWNCGTVVAISSLSRAKVASSFPGSHWAK